MAPLLSVLWGFCIFYNHPVSALGQCTCPPVHPSSLLLLVHRRQEDQVTKLDGITWKGRVTALA